VRCRSKTIDLLPDVALLEILELYLYESVSMNGWHTLVHVCRKWRNVVLGSPRCLDLKLLCTSGTPVRETLAVWPPLPIFIRDWGHSNSDMNDIVAALEHNDCVCGIRLWRVTDLELEGMQEPFPELTELELLSESGPVPVVPDSFLGGYPPHNLSR